MFGGRYDCAGSIPDRITLSPLYIRNGHQFIIKAIFAIIVYFCQSTIGMKYALLCKPDKRGINNFFLGKYIY